MGWVLLIIEVVPSVSTETKRGVESRIDAIPFQVTLTASPGYQFDMHDGSCC